MRITDVMSGFDMSTFPMIGLVIFGIVFLALVIRVLRAPRDKTDRQASLPLEDGVSELKNGGASHG